MKPSAKNLTIRGAIAVTVLVATAATGTAPSRATDQATIYVSLSGNDQNPGTHSAPVRDLWRAQQLVRGINQNMSGNITVDIEPGTYRLNAPLKLGPADSGTNGYDVAWTSDPNDGTVISGAVRISGWSLFDRARGIWSAPAPKTLRTRQLYVNGVRATLASGRPPVQLTEWWAGYEAANSAMAHWRNPAGIDFVYTGQLGLMTEPICPVATIIGKFISMANPCWSNSTRRVNNYVGYGALQLPTYIENAFELLGKPGQFYLDTRAHRVYYEPRPGQDMTTADVEAPAIETLVEGAGTSGHPLHNITFSNLQFSYATWLRPGNPEGFSEIQAGYTLTGSSGYSRQGLCHFVHHGTCPFGAWNKEPGNLQFFFDQNLSFANDRFVHLGAAGLNLDNGSQADAVTGCVFTDISGNGIEIGNVDLPRAGHNAQTLNVSVTDSHLYDLGIEFHGAIGILVGYAAGTTISHNQLDHLPYSAISMGWGGWPDKAQDPPVANFSHDNSISDNLIFDYVQILSDGGGVYTLGLTGSSMATGEKILHNVIHDQLNWSYALHSDNGATYVTNEGNVLYNNNYDWAGNHTDFRPHHGSSRSRTRDPQLILNNYWQQGDASEKDKTVTERDNHVIAGPDQAPAGIVNAAGIEPAYRSILTWHPWGQTVPNAPSGVSTVYAYQGKAIVSWLPSFAEGDSPVTSYTITACRVIAAHGERSCAGKSPPALTVPRADFDNLGYAVVTGLTNNENYTFTVTANSANGSSTASIPSRAVRPTTALPKPDGRVPGVYPKAGRSSASVIWYPPHVTLCPWWVDWCKRPVLKYKLTLSDHTGYLVSSLSQLIVSNHSGRVLDVVTGLKPGHDYRFTVRPWNPGGYGPPMTSGPITIAR